MSSKPKFHQHDPLIPTIRSNRNRTSRWFCKVSNILRICILLTLCAIITLAIVYNDFTINLFESFLEWMKNNIIYGSVAFIIIYIICTIVLIPGALLTLGAGFVYADILGTVVGVLTATLIVWISACIGASLSFWNGRYLFRQCAVSYAIEYKYLEIIEQIVTEYGFSVTFWLRMSSVTPYNVFNYLMGITSARSIDYIFAHIGMMPDVAMYCFIGASISEMVEIAETGIGDNMSFLIVMVVTLLLSIIGIVFISYYAKKKFDKMVSNINGDNQDCNRSMASEMQIVSIKCTAFEKQSRATV